MDFLLSIIRALPGSVAQGLIWGIMAIGVFVTFKLLDYADLTVDGSIATGGAVCVVGIVSGLNPALALGLAFLAGALAGLVTGLLHSGFAIPPILSGILSQLALYSINMRIMGKSNMAVSVDKYALLLSSRNNTTAIVVSALFVAAIIGFLYWFFGTEIGSAIRATGSNPAMASSQGININTMKVIGLAMSNGVVALSGALLAQYSGAADVKMGQGAIVIGLAAVIIGEVIFGKIFRNMALRLLGVGFGAIIYYLVIAVVVRLGLSPTDLKLFSACLVAVFLALPHLKEKFIEKKAINEVRRDA